MNTVTVQLGDVCEFVRGITFPSGEGKPVPFDNSIACLTTSGVQEDVAWNSRRFVQHTRVGNAKQMLQGLNLDQIREFRVPVPPLCRQQQFLELAKRVERLRAVQREALRQAEHLFASLLHRAFRAEL